MKVTKEVLDSGRVLAIQFEDKENYDDHEIKSLVSDKTLFMSEIEDTDTRFKVGLYGGKFIIPHMGHYRSMLKAAGVCDELHVIISYDDDYENKIEHHPSTPIKNHVYRLRWWKMMTKHLNHVHVHSVYEKQGGKFENWAEGCQRMIEAIGKPVDAIFTSEIEYDQYLYDLWSEQCDDFRHVMLDHMRTEYPISSTKILKDGIMRYWDMIPSVVRSDYVKRVVVVGSESNGKSTLVRSLAELYSTNYVDEMGRVFYQEIGDYETLKEDYRTLAINHAYEIEKAVKDSRKVIFIDTDAWVTLNFSNIYHDNAEQSVVEAIAKTQKFDLWLFLEPDVEWVDDGTRNLSSNDQRRNASESLRQLIEKSGNKMVNVSGNYNQRMKIAINAVNNLLR